MSEFIIYDTKKLFFKALAALRALKPDIDDYFFDIDSDDPAEGPSFSLLAMNKMFQYFEEEFHFPTGILSAQPVSALPELLIQMVKAPPHQFRGWIIRNDLDEFDPHVVPVFALNYQGKTHLFIFDSLGHTISRDLENSRISASLSHLIKHFQNDSEFSANVQIYSSVIKRQNSEVGCATFSLHDLKNLCERHLGKAENIIDFYASQTPDFQPRLLNEDLQIKSNLRVFELNTLPPEMMKLTQSYRKIDSYKQRPPVLSPPIPRFIRTAFDGTRYDTLQDLRALDHSVTEIMRMSPDGNAVNLYVEQKRFADIVYMLSRYFNRTDDPGTVFRRNPAKVLFQ